ncbi:MAG: hypothetical protein CMM01_26145 [Rhodopirellula sp.]|nr:hypothetical protein [Rhodopirellula sp.]
MALSRCAETTSRYNEGTFNDGTVIGLTVNASLMFTLTPTYNSQCVQLLHHPHRSREEARGRK